MKKATVISLIVLFLLTSTECHQLFKVPVLLHHYIEHKRQDAHISFLAFLEIHYFGNIKHNPKSHKHERLPFKSECSGFGHSVIAEVSLWFSSLHCYDFDSHEENGLYRENFYILPLQSSIWQPPRTV